MTERLREGINWLSGADSRALRADRRHDGSSLCELPS